MTMVSNFLNLLCITVIVRAKSVTQVQILAKAAYISFHSNALKKGISLSVLPQWWVNSKKDSALSPWLSNYHQKRKLWIQTSFTLHKNWPCVTYGLWWQGWVKSYIFINLCCGWICVIGSEMKLSFFFQNNAKNRAEKKFKQTLKDCGLDENFVTEKLLSPKNRRPSFPRPRSADCYRESQGLSVLGENWEKIKSHSGESDSIKDSFQNHSSKSSHSDDNSPYSPGKYKNSNLLRQ